MRVTVGMIVGQIGAGRSIKEILAECPYLERKDVMQALRYKLGLAFFLVQCDHFDKAKNWLADVLKRVNLKEIIPA